jgi:alpha-1,2-mannosyltransferase
LPTYWLLLVAVVTVWALRSAAHMWRRGEHLPAFTVVGLAATIASPISWIHHLWWVVPALLIIADEALRRRSRALLLGTFSLALLFTSRVPDLTRAPLGHHLTVGTLLGENAYAMSCLALLLIVSYLVSRRCLRTTDVGA